MNAQQSLALATLALGFSVAPASAGQRHPQANSGKASIVTLRQTRTQVCTSYPEWTCSEQISEGSSAVLAVATTPVREGDPRTDSMKPLVPASKQTDTEMCTSYPEWTCFPIIQHIEEDQGAVDPTGAVTMRMALKKKQSQAQNTQQTAAVKRNVLLKQDMNIPGYEAVMALVELPPGSAEGRHTHPAEVYVFVQEGSIFLEAVGKPDVTLKAGDIFYIAPGQVHQAINKSNATAKLAAVFITEKGKPLTTKAE